MGARVLSATVVLSLVSTPAFAQQSLPSASLQMGLPSAPLQTTLPSASLPPPVPPVTAVSQPSPSPSPFQATPRTYNPPPGRRLHVDPRFCCNGFVGGFAFPWYPGLVAPAPEQRVPERRTGYVQLRVRPGNVQVFVDGYYIGTVDELRGLVRLEEGPHRVELRAPGYETVTFDVRVEADVTVPYSAELAASRPVQKPPAPLPKTFYVIPNCYAGDKPPIQSTLPPSCDVANVRTIPPVVNAVRPTAPGQK